jgi:hypothetical protein
MTKHNYSYLVLLLLLPVTANSQVQEKIYEGLPSLVWPQLIDITYQEQEDEFGAYQLPVFSQKVKELSGKEVYLPGYMIPFEGSYKGSRFILSALPLNACFFCGVGGPETVIEVHLKSPVEYTEKPVEVKGILRLNPGDPDAMIYILEDATFQGELDF